MREQTVGEMLGGYTEMVPHTRSPRQERMERAILEALRSRGTRSELRGRVIEFTDYLRLRGVPADGAVSSVRALGMRATPFMNADDLLVAVGDSATDRMAMMVRWCSARYHRAD